MLARSQRLNELSGRVRIDPDEPRAVRVDLDERCWLEYRPCWLGTRQADDLTATLAAELCWEQRSIVMFGRAVMQPRLIAWGGERAYRYSGQTLELRPLSATLSALRKRVAAAAGASFNHVLVNRYRDGTDSMGFHADDEPELGRDPVLASLSLGVTRRFVLAAKTGPKRRQTIELEHGSLLIMGGALQHHYRHAVPKQRRVTGERLNLTFRRLLR
jgi:alkylated DNA repair dioxygenase AlkB